ncbi:DUF2207 domain-containing protein [Saccharopolyspora sp. MS10]|uniref:DUF2207 domain-containing protein n=1 Tax=Saccharopolyspora sp. MS10 TaxID=3385973 RepID=UPI0039A373AF
MPGKLSVLGAVLGVLTALAPPAAAEPVNVLPGTAATEVRVKLERDGALTVTERIEVPPGPPAHRVLPLRHRAGPGAERVFEVSEVRFDGGDVRVDPDAVRLTARPGTATFDYVLRGAVAEDSGGQQVRWQITGGWDVPLDRAVVEFRTPHVPRSISCSAGPVGGTERCDRFELDRAQQVRVLQFGLAPGERVDLVVRLSAGAVPSNAVVERDFDPLGAVSGGAVAGAAGVLALLVGALGVLGRLRLRESRAFAVAAPPVGLRMPLADGTTVFATPDGVRPGEIGTLLTGRIGLGDLTATTLDLAARRYLRIEEVGGDWKLLRTHPPDAGLREHERAVLGLLFGDAERVLVSELGDRSPAPVRDALYADLVAQDWFARRPDRRRNPVWWTGVVVSLGGAALVPIGPSALVGVVVALSGAALTAGARLLPARTPRGRALVVQLRGLREHLVTTTEVGEVRSRSLPYALALGTLDPELSRTAAPDWYRPSAASLPAFAAALTRALDVRPDPPRPPETVTSAPAPR